MQKPEHDDWPVLPISHATIKLRRSLRNCLSIPALSNPNEDWAENRLMDFNLWVSGVGALAGQSASLDRRLADQPDAQTVIVGLLTVAFNLVEQCARLGMYRALM